jgi:hypothetical protein
MPKYRVTLREIAFYEVVVTAKNRDDAADKAEERFCAEGCTAFPVEIPERDADEIVLLNPRKRK